ncbi:hypothetical protein [Actinoplanes sp. NPDC020271]|uniref:hypothetical protein n=1 Tax=Actinoplanes sp. NPDC020271 TaxID=3363896 RepID=UPI0037B949DC
MTVTVDHDELRELVRLVRLGAEANARPDLVARLSAGPVTAGQVIRSLQSLEIDLRNRRAGLCDPGRGARLAAEARHAETRLRRFREQSARWARTLGEAVGTADSDVGYALQRRVRCLVDEGTAMIESRVPRADLDRWLQYRLAAEVAESDRALRRTAETITTRLAVIAPIPPVTLVFGAPAVVAPPWPAPTGRQPMATRLTGVLMPAYSGIAISFVMLRDRAPDWLLVTAAIILAVGLGGAALAGDRWRQADRERAEALHRLSSTADALRLALTKQLRDGLRAIEQRVHAAVDAAVNEQTARLTAAAGAAKRAAQAHLAGRAVSAVDADLASIQDLLLRASRLRAPAW